MIVDKQGRKFRNLRVSLTAACNYACTYCVPNGQRLMKAQNELSAKQMINGVSYLIDAAGIDRVRITGGEPLVAKNFDEFLLSVMNMPLNDVSLTTNGQLLSAKMKLLKSSGIKRINISLDSLNPLSFKKINRGGELDSVLHGIEQALDAGIRIKMNMVPMRTANADQVVPLLEYCLQRGIELRYIELMRMGHLSQGNQFSQDFMSMADLLELISKHYEYTQTDAPFDSTAVRYEVAGRGVFGIIANESAPFCRSCTRLRISADGYLYGCLSNTNRHYVAELLNQDKHIALPKLQTLLTKALADKQDVAFAGGVTVMKMIGG